MTRDHLSSVGGARIGWVNATWPFARLTARRDQLILNATVIGKYSFSPEQVVAVEKYTGMWPGIRIHHSIATYPRKIVFWCCGRPESLIRKIQETGFVAKADPDSVPTGRGMPVRWQALVAIVALWNGLLMLDMRQSGGSAGRPGTFALVALLLLFLGSVGIWRSPLLQRAILKPGRSCGEIKAWLYLSALVSGLLSVLMLLSQLAGRG